MNKKSFFIDFKMSVWERLYINNEIKDDIINKLKSGEIKTPYDIARLYNLDLYNSGEILEDTYDYIDSSNNGGAPTIEVHISDNGLTDKTIWDNGRTDN